MSIHDDIKRDLELFLRTGELVCDICGRPLRATGKTIPAGDVFIGLIILEPGGGDYDEAPTDDEIYLVCPECHEESINRERIPTDNIQSRRSRE